MFNEYYIYTEPAGSSAHPVHHILSGNAILAEYWPYWSAKMVEAKLLTQGELVANYHILAMECIEDWCTIHWAAKATKETLANMFLEA